jgi:hypothetical protein
MVPYFGPSSISEFFSRLYWIDKMLFVLSPVVFVLLLLDQDWAFAVVFAALIVVTASDRISRQRIEDMERHFRLYP